jgi:hypothetical protein
MNYFEIDFTLNPLLPAREVLVAELAELGFESFLETDEGVKAYIQEADFTEDILQNLMTTDIPNNPFLLRKSSSKIKTGMPNGRKILSPLLWMMHA